MNIETGELFKFLIDEQLDNMRDIVKVPDELRLEAIKELGDKDYVKVKMFKNTPLTKWAKAAKKKKRQMEKKSKQINRRK